MGYLVLARKWRPQQFGEVVGQEHVTSTLSNAISADRVAHAYLFAGPRGIGKTSMARILAKALNCEKGPTASPCGTCPSCAGIAAGNSIDVMEIDGASNRGIEQIRELRENVKFAPAASRYKIYIIDEVHQITSEAWNALLKTLEEPPSHVKFFFATTEPYKVLPTILSRCQRFDLRAISPREIVGRLVRIAASEKIQIDEEACYAIARYAQGSMRDAVSILDQLVSFSEGDIREENVISMLGLVRESVLREMTEALLDADCRRGLELIAAVSREGKELPLFLADWITHLRAIMLAIVAQGGEEIAAGVSPEAWKAIEEQRKRISLDQISYVLDILTRAEQSLRRSLSPRILFELAFVKASRAKDFASVSDLLLRIHALEERLGGGGAPAKAPAPAPRGGPDRAGHKGPVKKAPPGPPCANPEAPSRSGPEDAPRTKAGGAEGVAALARIAESWHEVLDRVAAVRPLLKSCLMDGTPVACDGEVLCIEFPEDRWFHCGQLDESKHKQLVRKIISEKMGIEINLRFVVRKKEEKEAPAPPPAAARAEIENIKKHPVVQSALAMFKAQVVEIRK